MTDLFGVAEAIEERAAIMEFDAGMQRAAAEVAATVDVEAHRHACEVRWVASMASNRERIAYVEMVAQKRGTDAATRLRDGARAEIARRNVELTGATEKR